MGSQQAEHISKEPVKPPIGNREHLLIISDDLKHTAALKELLPNHTHLSFAALMRNGPSWRDAMNVANAVWFDTPYGKVLRRTKMSALENVLCDLVEECGRRNIVCIALLPFIRTRAYAGSSTFLPHGRWKRILQAWRPETVSICCCKLMNSLRDCRYGSIHKKYRVYASGCSLASTFDCKNRGAGEKRLGRNDICTFVHSLFDSGLIKFNESSREFQRRLAVPQ